MINNELEIVNNPREVLLRPDQDVIDCFRGDYYFLSNFYTAHFKYNGLAFRNSEAAFQAQKTDDVSVMVLFGDLKGGEAKKLGRRVQLIEDWEQKKIKVMCNVVKEKFKQNEDLKSRLFETGNVYLEEGNQWGDTYWGVCNGRGKNILGQILMKVREDFRR